MLDNVEQVVESLVGLAPLLTSCPGLTVLTTSRIVLRLSGEHDYPVPPLTLPDPQQPATLEHVMQCEAVRLFVARAQATTPSFTVTTATAPAVAKICQRLDGLPLAMELAAARLRFLPPQALVERLDRRLTVLTGGSRDLPERQQTLRATIAWSHDLLTSPEQDLFRCLAVFGGGWTLEAAEGIVQASASAMGHRGDLNVFEGLASLVDKNLVRRVEEADGETRCTLLETIREFAEERLADAPPDEVAALRRAHAAHYLARAEQADAAAGHASRWVWLSGEPRDSPAWRRRVRREQDNLRAALRWAHEDSDTTLGLRLVAALAWFWGQEGPWTEARSWMEVFRTLHRVEDSPPPPVRLTTWTVIFAGLGRMQGDAPWATVLLREEEAALRRQGDDGGLAVVLACQGVLRGWSEAAVALYEESLALCRALDDHEGAMVVLKALGRQALTHGEVAHGAALFAQAYAAAQAARASRLVVSLLLDHCEALLVHGDLRGARTVAATFLALGGTETIPTREVREPLREAGSHESGLR